MSEEISLEQIISDNNSQCASTVVAYKRELQKVRTGRASTGMVEGIQVDYYGSKTALSHLAQISAPDASQIVVQVFDAGAVEAVEKAIISSELGFNPSRDGNTLRILVPPLTEDRRKEIVKFLGKISEDFRVSLRNHRRDANDIIKNGEKDGSFSKDDAKRATEQIQKQLNKHIADVDSLLQKKEAECMSV